ncbi:substrate-binding periplasmic protein [Marinobacter sp. X15-166B]|uniref:substrate-binding periplasmic protein n=1 Tax=Marinobacter sp. X15-166B TaxID=1897620 RepID=UPI00114D3590|nr:transporter substrate-binding domain-containing protein [Marinobacter sp. X15-166B]
MWLSLCVGLMWGLPGVAAESPPVAEVAIPEVWPWAYEGSQGEPVGILPLFFERLSAAAEVPFQMRLRPHRRALKEMGSGAADLAVFYDSPHVAEGSVRVASVASTRVLLAVRAGEPVPEALDQRAAGLSVGYIRGTYYGEAFEQAELIHKVAVQDLRQAIEMLRLQRIDAVIASEHVFRYTLAAMGLDDALFSVGVAADRLPASLYMSKNSALLGDLPHLREALRRLHESGELQQTFALP